MPIYEYRCQACGHKLDALQKLADAPLKDCPECASPSLKRLVSAPAFRLKGAGWYETDFKSEKENRRNLADGGANMDDASRSSESAKGSESAKSSESAKGPEAAKSSDATKGSGSAKGDAGKSTTTKESSSSGGSSTAAA